MTRRMSSCDARSVSFEEAVFHIQNGDVLDVIKHPNAARYPSQNIIVLNMEGYVYLVPCRRSRRPRSEDDHSQPKSH